MLYCKKCKINIKGSLEKCPLCQGDLDGSACENDNVFPPAISSKQKYRLFLKILALITVIIVSVCFAVNASIIKQTWWLKFVLFGFISLWLIIGILMKKRDNAIRAVFLFNITVSILVLLWDFATGFSGWSVNYVLPVLYIASIIASVSFAGFLHLKPEEYLFYLFLNIITAFIPFIYLIFSMPFVIYPSAVCIAFGVITLATLIIFKGAFLKEELIRRFHF